MPTVHWWSGVRALTVVSYNYNVMCVYMCFGLGVSNLKKDYKKIKNVVIDPF